MEKEIDWSVALVMAIAYVGAVNVIFFIVFYILDGEFTGWETHIYLSIIVVISGVIRGVIIPYKGILEKEETDDDDYYKPPEIVGYAWTALIVILFIYVFFIM
jgi:NADH:ubiquinone oxidoreductase subunit 6 (subunit J)